jgi:hypothetical protein
MSNSENAIDRMLLPDSLLTIASVESAVELYFAIGLKNVLLHAPTSEGGCSCGKVHDKSNSGSSSIGKHPIQPSWQKKSPSLDELKDQISRCRFTPNIGIVLGRQPEGEYLIAVDVDDANRISELETEYGPLPETPRCDSGRGYRLFFSAPPEIDVDRLTNVTALGSTKENPKPGVDVKVEGGQVVVAPSLHANGKRYAWTVVGAVAPLPVHWAMQLLKKLDPPKFVEKYTPAQMNKPGAARNRGERYLEVAVTNESRALAACGHGNRNNTLYSTACRMFEYCGGMHLSHKWQWVHDEMLAAAKACGLTDNESRKTLASAEKRVRESGKVRAPMVLANPRPESTPPGLVSTEPSLSPDGSPAPWTAPTEDPWGLSPRSQGRPIIKITTEIHENVTESIKALTSEESLYQRDRKLVQVARVTREQSESSSVVIGDDGEPHHQLVEGTPELFDIEVPTVRELLSKVAVFQKWKKDSFVTVIPSEEIVSAVRKRREFPGIRKIIGIIETPTLRPDGVIVQSPGYDHATRYLYMPNCKFPDVNDVNTTQDNARWAYKFLSEVFADFPYVNDAHKAVPIAAILTLISRPAILGSIPAVLFDASTRGSGKTLQTDAIATITTGRGAPRMNYTSDDVELEKILGGYALKGSAFICLDNVPVMRPFGGGPIDRMITSRDEVELRILGSTKVLTLPWRALIMATGNNMNLYGDTSRRVLMARLEPKEESPEHRTKFKHDDLLGWIREQRPRLVSAALLILRAYVRAGRPDMGCARWGSFEEWSRLIPHAIVFAGGSDPMNARPEKEEEVDSELRSVRCFVSGMRKLMENDDFRVSSVIDLLYKSERKRDTEGNMAPDGLEDLRDAIETLVGKRGMKFEGRGAIPDPVELGKRMGSFKGRVIGNLKLTSKTGGGGVMKWRVEQISPNQ